MRKRKMLRNTTLFISVLVISTLLVGTFFLIYRHISTYNNQLELMQKDLLINFQTKVDETLDTSMQYISVWLLEEEAIRVVEEEAVDNYNLIKLQDKILRQNFLFIDLNCAFGFFKPDTDVFITNSGIAHSDNLEMQYGFMPNCMEYISRLPEKEFVNNCYLAEDISDDNRRINLFIKRTLAGNPQQEVYGFVSLDLRSVARQVSQLDDHVFFAYKNDNCFFSSQSASPDSFRLLKEPSNLIYDLDYANGAPKQNNVLMLIMYGALFLLLAGLGLYGSFFLAKLLNRPIDNIIKQLSDDEMVDVYDEESYIRNRFVEIKTVNQQLATQISDQEQYVKQNFVRDLLFGIIDQEVLYQHGVGQEIRDLCGDVALAVLEENKSISRGSASSKQITALLEAKFEHSVVVFLNADQIAVIVNGVSYEIFKTAMTQVILQIDEWYGISYTASVSTGTIASSEELSRLFSEALLYLQNAEFGYDKLIITKEDLHERSVYNYYYPLEFEKDIIACIANNDFDRAMQMLKIILDKNLNEMNLDKAALIELKFAFVGTIKRILQVLQKTEADLFGEGSILYLELSACKTPEETGEKICEMFGTIRSFAESTIDSTNIELIDSMEAYIRCNYQREDMSLLLLAEHFNLTTGYISKIFKKCRQVNFKDYLSAYRIKQATEILDRDPHIRVVDLARQVGYDNVNSFIRNFKKFKQVSPGEYKKQQ